MEPINYRLGVGVITVFLFDVLLFIDKILNISIFTGRIFIWIVILTTPITHIIAKRLNKNYKVVEENGDIFFSIVGLVLLAICMHLVSLK